MCASNESYYTPTVLVCQSFLVIFINNFIKHRAVAFRQNQTKKFGGIDFLSTSIFIYEYLKKLGLNFCEILHLNLIFCFTAVSSLSVPEPQARRSDKVLRDRFPQIHRRVFLKYRIFLKKISSTLKKSILVKLQSTFRLINFLWIWVYRVAGK